MQMQNTYTSKLNSIICNCTYLFSIIRYNWASQPANERAHKWILLLSPFHIHARSFFLKLTCPGGKLRWNPTSLIVQSRSGWTDHKLINMQSNWSPKLNFLGKSALNSQFLTRWITMLNYVYQKTNGTWKIKIKT